MLGKKAELIADFEKYFSLTDDSPWRETIKQLIEELKE